MQKSSNKVIIDIFYNTPVINVNQWNFLIKYFISFQFKAIYYLIYKKDTYQ